MVYHYETKVVYFWQRTEVIPFSAYHEEHRTNVLTTVNINSDYLVVPIITSNLPFYPLCS